MIHFKRLSVSGETTEKEVNLYMPLFTLCNKRINHYVQCVKVGQTNSNQCAHQLVNRSIQIICAKWENRKIQNRTKGNRLSRRCCERIHLKTTIYHFYIEICTIFIALAIIAFISSKYSRSFFSPSLPLLPHSLPFGLTCNFLYSVYLNNF